MTSEKYKYYLNKANRDFKELINDTQSKLDNSKTKNKDFIILRSFWKKFTTLAVKNWNDSSTLLLDDESPTPMIESVSKQFCNMLFDIKNIDLLFDLSIFEGFE